MNNEFSIVQGSFRDPSGFLFLKNGVLYRQINHSYKKEYENFINTGLYESLTSDKKLVSHEEVSFEDINDHAALIIKPIFLSFISYPYEWSFSQLKDAALLTLDIMEISLDKDMILKDASAYNIQFMNGKPIFIDTLSFESYKEGLPWVAYKQFCQHFLAPLALMSHTDIRLNKLLMNFIDGIPLDLASSLLPMKTKFNFSLAIHIHAHALQQKKNAGQSIKKSDLKMSKLALQALIDSLKTAINKLSWKPIGTEWEDYYISNNNYNAQSLNSKEKLVENVIHILRPDHVCDFGANDGRFSHITAKYSKLVISCDIDPACVEKNYLYNKNNNLNNIHPLLIDLSNPTPNIGWYNKERDSFINRKKYNLALALGLIHHLAISNNLPLKEIAKFFNDTSEYLLIEWIPKEDSQVIKLLSTRDDIFDNYIEEDFLNNFLHYYTLEETRAIDESVRKLFLFKKK